MIKHSYHIAAPVPEDVRNKAATLIQRIQYDNSASRHLGLLLEVISDLTDSGLDFYFLSPLRRVGAGSMTMKAAQMGISSTQKGMNMVIRKVLQRLDDQQLGSITGFLQEIMFDPDAAIR